MKRHGIPTIIATVFLCALGAAAAVSAQQEAPLGLSASAEEFAGAAQASVHTIDCTGTKACEGQVHTCPPGQPCHIICDGLDACDDGIFNCPEGFPCTVTCEGTDGCGDSTLNCSGDAPCKMECGTANAACEGAFVDCANGPCEATCNGSQAPMMWECEQSSSCTRCGDGVFVAGGPLQMCPAATPLPFPGLLPGFPDLR